MVWDSPKSPTPSSLTHLKIFHAFPLSEKWFQAAGWRISCLHTVTMSSYRKDPTLSAGHSHSTHAHRRKNSIPKTDNSKFDLISLSKFRTIIINVLVKFALGSKHSDFPWESLYRQKKNTHGIFKSLYTHIVFDINSHISLNKLLRNHNKKHPKAGYCMCKN